MNILLIGPYPPPHGGISVHVASMRDQLTRMGIQCRVLNADRMAPPSQDYIRAGTRTRMVAALLRHARRGWILHLHTNGHNRGSWMLALLCGLAGRFGPASLLTLHSGMTPDYLEHAGALRRLLVRSSLALYSLVVCVNDEIARAVRVLAPSLQSEVVPAFLPVSDTRPELPADVRARMETWAPLLSTAMFFRPEYGFDLLIQAVATLRQRHPRLGCVVMGDGANREEARKAVRERGMEDAFLITGDLKHSTCLQVMRRSDVFVRPTLSDGDAVCVREALALGVPVVASKVGARPPQAVLFEPGNVGALVSCVENALRVRVTGAPATASPDWSPLEAILRCYSQVRFSGRRPPQRGQIPAPGSRRSESFSAQWRKHGG